MGMALGCGGVGWTGVGCTGAPAQSRSVDVQSVMLGVGAMLPAVAIVCYGTTLPQQPCKFTPYSNCCRSWDFRPYDSLFTAQASPCKSELLLTATQPLAGRAVEVQVRRRPRF